MEYLVTWWAKAEWIIEANSELEALEKQEKLWLQLEDIPVDYKPDKIEIRPVQPEDLALCRFSTQEG